MSTRCQVEFIYQWKDSDNKRHSEKRTVYRHSDGYPSAMMQDLLEFLRWNNGRNDQPDYAAANWIYWNKRRDEDCYLNDLHRKRWEKRTHDIKWNDPIVASDPNHVLKIGFGVDVNNQYHGDIEYLYKVTMSTGLRGDINTIGVTAYAVRRATWDAKHVFKRIGKIMFRYDMTDEQIVAEGKRISDLNDKMKGDE